MGEQPRRLTPAVPVVGVGASAGGLDALERMFAAMPPDTGAAFVVVEHLSRDHVSMVDELLARVTPMRVEKVEDGARARCAPTPKAWGTARSSS